MAYPISIILSNEDEKKLREIIDKGIHGARVLKRTEILLKLTEGLSSQEIGDIAYSGCTDPPIPEVCPPPVDNIQFHKC